MLGDTTYTSAENSESPHGRFSWAGLVVMAVGAVLIGLGWARIGAVVQSYFPPSLVVPAVLGALVGLTFVALARFTSMGHRPTIIAATLVATVIAVGGSGCQVCKSFSLSNWTVAIPSAGVAFDPIIALLAALLAAAVALPAVSVPYCNRCGRWFRTALNGKIDETALRRLAKLLVVECPEHVRSPRYRLSACRCEGGPTRLELSWERTRGNVELATVWLDAGKQRKVLEIVEEFDGNE